jgi:hypothetical protein
VLHLSVVEVDFVAVVDSVVEVDTNKKFSLLYILIHILFIVLGGGGGGGDSGGYRGRGVYLCLTCHYYNYFSSINRR